MDCNSELNELTALFEKDGFDEDLENGFDVENEIANTISDFDDGSTKEMADMEAEYEKLQQQMVLLKEKMKSKKKSSTKHEKLVDAKLMPNSGQSDSCNSGETPAPKRSFCEAFGFSLNSVHDEGDSNHVRKNKTASCAKSISCSKSPDTSASVRGSSFYPSQKKPRISHAPQTSSLKPKVKLKAKATPATNALNKLVVETELFSKIRLKKRFLDANDLKESMEGKLFLRPSLIRPTMSIAEDRDWVTIAVVARCNDPQSAKNGKNFVIWQLSDLVDCTRVVSLFLFGKVYEELGKTTPVGTVVGLLNPTIMPPKKEGDSNKNYNSVPALTIDVSARLTKIGVAADLGWCNATKYRNKQPAGKCLAVINKQHGDVCVFHMKSQHKKLSAKRGELQGTAGGGVPAKFKQDLWKQAKGDQFFYGGQTFSAAPPSACRPVQRKESKMKLTDILASNAGGSSSTAQKDEVERSKIMQAISGIEEKQSLSGCSDKFAEMLASGDNVAGSRQFLNHLQKKKRAEKDSPATLSAAEVLKQQKQLLGTKNPSTAENSKSNKNPNRDNNRGSDDTNPPTSSGKARGGDVKYQSATSGKKSRSGISKVDDDAIQVSTARSRKNSTACRNVHSANDVMKNKAEKMISSTTNVNHSNSKTKDRTDVTMDESSAAKCQKQTNKAAVLCGSEKDALCGAEDRSKCTSTLTGVENPTQQSAHDLLLQMKRERYLKRKENKEIPSSRPISIQSAAPKLGGGVAGNDVDLFGDWMVRRNSRQLTSSPSLAEMRKKKAIKKLRNSSGQIQIVSHDPNRPQIGASSQLSSNDKMKKRLEEKVAANRKDLGSKNKENKNSVKKVFSKLSEKEFKKILHATSSHQHELDLEEVERQEQYFNPLIKKEMMELKMAETYEVPAKIVSCQQCDYTFWGPHERCKARHHDLKWTDAKKKFFECSRCKHRTTTWNPYPVKPCRECGSVKLWNRTCMWKDKNVKLDSETLLLRGVEHSKFLNSIKSGDW